MKPGVPAWSAVVVVPLGLYKILAVNRGFSPRNPGLPGGDSEPTDATPADTARRELFEETGVRAKELRCMDQWVGERGQPVYAFYAPSCVTRRLRASSEGKPFWAPPEHLLMRSAEFRETARRLLTKLGRLTPAQVQPGAGSARHGQQ